MVQFKFLGKTLKYGLWALAVLMLTGTGLQPAHAQTSSPVPARIQVCIDAWDDAPANDICGDLSITRVGASTANDANQCSASGHCSITLNIGEHSRTQVMRVSVTADPDDFNTTDICVKADAAGTNYEWTARAAGCESGETTASTAQSQGLPAL
ncbi:MAG: hypothetical protein OXF11_08180 [Deltaproteobacteria bacterium]|nr:hypothetical protein [Deltaproteobacteria bacterium]